MSPPRARGQNELIDGVTARYYMPDNTLTVAQAVKLAAALHQKQSVGFVTLQNGGTHWYDNYVNYAVANSLIEAAYQSKSAEDMNKAVTRAEFVHILSKLLNAGTINTVNSIPDVKSGDAYADEIFAFYRAGILTGSDRLGTFHPDKQPEAQRGRRHPRAALRRDTAAIHHPEIKDKQLRPAADAAGRSLY